MDDKQKFDACMKQAEFAIKRFDERRNYEWKVTLGLWALILASIKVLPSIKALQSKTIPLWVGVVIVVAYAFAWLRGIWVANTNDKEMALHFRKHAEEILRNPDHTVPSSPGKIGVWSLRFWFGFLKNWSMLFQLVATIVIIVIAHIFIN